MSTLATADLPSEDEADQDFVPTLKSLHAGDGDKGSSDSSDSDGERPKKRRKKSNATDEPQEEKCVRRLDECLYLTSKQAQQDRCGRYLGFFQ